MENKDYINEIIGYLKDDRPAHANASMRRYMEHLGFTENEIGKEDLYFHMLLSEKSFEISKLQQKLYEQQKNINELVNTRKYTKIIYHVGLLTGVAFILVGFFSNTFVATIAGFGISIVSIVGLYEAIINKW